MLHAESLSNSSQINTTSAQDWTEVSEPTHQRRYEEGHQHLSGDIYHQSIEQLSRIKKVCLSLIRM